MVNQSQNMSMDLNLTSNPPQVKEEKIMGFDRNPIQDNPKKRKHKKKIEIPRPTHSWLRKEEYLDLWILKLWRDPWSHKQIKHEIREERIEIYSFRGDWVKWELHKYLEITNNREIQSIKIVVPLRLSFFTSCFWLNS